MKYTRVEIPGRMIIKRSKPFIYFFIIIPLVAIVLGGVFVKIIVKPNLHNIKRKVIPAIHVTETVSKNVNKISSVYFLQVGVFTNINNAGILTKGIKEKGFDSCVVEDKGVYRVIVEVSNDKNELIKINDKLKSLGYSCIIHEKNFNTQYGDEKNVGKDLKEYIDCIKGILSVQLDINSQLKSNKQVERSIFDNSLKELNKKYNSLAGIKLQEDVTKSITNFNIEFLKILDEYSKAIDNKDLTACKKVIIEEIIFFSEFLQTF